MSSPSLDDLTLPIQISSGATRKKQAILLTKLLGYSFGDGGAETDPDGGLSHRTHIRKETQGS